MPHTPKITLIGTGLMGAPMARNILNSGFDLTIWNRSPDKALPLAQDGARIAPSAAEAIAGADIFITMLSDGYAAQELLGDAAFVAALNPGMIWIDMCSTKPDHARQQAAQMAELGVAHLDAPVSGGTRGAEAATLAIMVGGDKGVFETALPLLSTMGRAVHVGPSGSGQLCKLANQAIVAITISAVSEATLLVEQGGADPAALRDALKGGFADSVILQQHGTRMSERDFAPGGPSHLQLKDLDNALAEAEAFGLDLPATQSMRDRFAYLVNELEAAGLDHSALYLELLHRNGLS